MVSRKEPVVLPVAMLMLLRLMLMMLETAVPVVLLLLLLILVVVGFASWRQNFLVARVERCLPNKTCCVPLGTLNLTHLGGGVRGRHGLVQDRV